jgi:capsular polysaccharide biosynthesis protein
VELSGYLAVAKRWWWTLLVATWVAGIAGWLVASSIPPTYEARAQLLVGPYNTDRDTLAASAVLVQTYSELITTEPLLRSAIAEAQADMTPDALETVTRVTADNTTRILSIRVQDTDPGMAAQLANKLADEISVLASRGTNRPEGQIQIIDFARAPTDPIAPQKSLVVALAAVAALVGAMVLVMLVEYLSAAVRSEQELSKITNLPFLGKVDTARSVPSNGRALIDNQPESAAAAAYRLVFAKLAFRERRAEPVRSVVVVGTGTNPATGQVAANLAAITARGGRQVILIDADMADAPVTKIFGLGDRSGLTDVAAAGRRADPTTAITRVTDTLSVVPRGLSARDDQLDVESAKAILAELAGHADFVIVNTGPLHLSAGALAWAQAGDAVTLVATLDQTRRDDLTYAVESLRLVGADVVGSILADRRRGFGRSRSGGRATQPTRRPAPSDRMMTAPVPATAGVSSMPPTIAPMPSRMTPLPMPTVVAPIDDDEGPSEDEPPPPRPSTRKSPRRGRQTGESST